MSEVFVQGVGAVSPAGWGIAALRDAIAKDQPFAPQQLEHPSVPEKLNVLRVPAANPRPGFLAHARLRRASPISHFAIASVLEALGPEPRDASGIAVIACVFSGCVNYSRRFYGETLKDPATASPLLFPETVFNAPASHISAYLGSSAINYTLVGDTGTLLTGLALGARWLLEGKAAQCLVVGTEEIDWLTADALRLFHPHCPLSEGAGAVLLTTTDYTPRVRLERVTDEFLYVTHGRAKALATMQAELGQIRPGTVLCESASGQARHSRTEADVWNDSHPARLRLKNVLGEGLMASAAWQVVLAADAISTGRAAESLVSIAGFHQHAVGAKFVGR